MKNQVCFAILLIFGLSFVVYLFPFNTVHAAKFQSGVTINPPSAQPAAEICANGRDDNNDGQIDEEPCAPAPAAAGTCGLQILGGVPIDYGQLNVGQVSLEKMVSYQNEGNATAQIMVKAGDWIGGTSASPVKLYGPEITRVSVTAGLEFAKKMALHSSPTSLGELPPGERQDSFWQLYADPKLSGSPHQEVTLDLTC